MRSEGDEKERKRPSEAGEEAYGGDQDAEAGGGDDELIEEDSHEEAGGGEPDPSDDP